MLRSSAFSSRVEVRGFGGRVRGLYSEASSWSGGTRPAVRLDISAHQPAGTASDPGEALFCGKGTNFTNFRPLLPHPPRPVRKIRSLQTGTTRPMRRLPGTRLPSESSARAPSPPDAQAPPRSAPQTGGLRITTGGSRIRRWETRPRGSVTDPKMRRHGGPRHDERPGPFRDDLGPAIALYATLRGLQPSPNRERLPPRTKRTKQKHEPRNVGLYHLTDAPNWLRFAYHL